MVSNALPEIRMKNKILILILILGGFFRLYKIDQYMEFLGDQGRDVVIVREFLTKGNLMFIGPQTSIGNMYLGPWYYYLIAPSLFLANYNPVGPAIFVALMGVASIYLLFLITKNIYDQKTALLASFLMAISPVAIKYNNFSWNPNVMPFFATLLFYSLLKKKYAIASIALVMILNSHYLGLLLLPLVAICLFYQKPKLQKLIAPLLIIILGFLPLILFDIKHHGQNINNIIKFFTVRQETVNLKPYKAIPSIVPMFSQVTNHLAFGNTENIGNILAIFVLFTFMVKSFIAYKSKKIPELLLAVWILSGVLGLALYKQHVYDHYFGFLQPAIFILVSTSVFLINFNFLRIIIILFLSYLSLSQNPFLNKPNLQLETVQKINSSILAESEGQSFNLALLAKNNYDPPYRYFFYKSGAKIVEIDKQKTKQLFVICELKNTDCQPLGNPEYNVAAFGIAKIDKQWQVNNISIYKLINE